MKVPILHMELSNEILPFIAGIITTIVFVYFQKLFRYMMGRIVK